MYSDLFTDIGNGRIYPVFTKDRSSKELISQTSIFFALHPSWQQRHENTDRFFRLDPENNYRSKAFKQTASAFGYRIEPTAPRDKHENGIAERSVGISCQDEHSDVEPGPLRSRPLLVSRNGIRV
jgi:hypothetical protein